MTRCGYFFVWAKRDDLTKVAHRSPSYYHKKRVLSIAYKNDEQRREYQRAYYQAHKDSKKRTKTSTEAKRQYNQKMYSRIVADIPKDLAEQFRTVTAEKGDSQAAIIKKAIEQYLEKNK